jgi:hypothetical protein
MLLGVYRLNSGPPLIRHWKNGFIHAYLLTLPLFAGVSRVRALSLAWTGSHARETLISRTTSPPTKKSSTIKSWPTFCDQYFWKFPLWNSRTDEKRREIWMVKVNVIFNDIRLLICLTPLQVNWVMVIN